VNDQQKQDLTAAGWTISVSRPRVYFIESADGATSLYATEDDADTPDRLLNPPAEAPVEPVLP
jgi:hypothetical protein